MSQLPYVSSHRLLPWLIGSLLPWTLTAFPAAAQSWTHHGSVTAGGQCDAVADDSRIYLIADRLVELSPSGTILDVDETVGDERQEAYAFQPAIALGKDGSLHVITRHGPADYDAGHNLRYRRRTPQGVWDTDMIVGAKVPRNYVVGLATLDDGRVFFAHSQEETLGSSVQLSELTNGVETPVGELMDSSWLRPDSDFRMRGIGQRVVLATGSPWPDGKTHYFDATPGANLASALVASHQAFASGSGRRGFPDLAVTTSGNVALTYGAHHEVYFSYRAGTNVLADRSIFDGLGDWKAFSTGLSAVGVTPSGSAVLAVGLQSDGSDDAVNSALLWTYAQGGQGTFAPPQSMGVTTSGGGGRLRPRIAAMSNSFHLFFVDNNTPGISMASITFDEPGQPDAGADAGADAAATPDAPLDSPLDSLADSPLDTRPDGAAGMTGEGGADSASMPIPTASGTAEDGDGCSCSASKSSGSPWLLIGFVALGLVRRRSVGGRQTPLSTKPTSAVG